MTQKTISETIFEKLCTNIGIPFTSVPCDDGKTPDFEIELCGNVVIVEIKQIDPNSNDKAILQRSHGTGSASGFCNSDNRVRRRINDASPQLKARSLGRLTTMVVLYDNGTFDGIDHTDIKTAMFGDEKVVVTISDNGTRHITPIHAGGGRRMTETCNTSISAVSLLRGSLYDPSLYIFHNHFATIPLNPAWLRYDRVHQFSLHPIHYMWEKS